MQDPTDPATPAIRPKSAEEAQADCDVLAGLDKQPGRTSLDTTPLEAGPLLGSWAPAGKDDDGGF